MGAREKLTKTIIFYGYQEEGVAMASSMIASTGIDVSLMYVIFMMYSPLLGE